MPVRNQTAVLGIFLVPAPRQELRIGSLVRDNTGAVSFIVDDAYMAIGPGRPVVSMAWCGANEDQALARLATRDDKIMRGGFLPPFFQNLLPEGALRELVEKEFGAGNFDEFDVLTKLGHDLPGAVVARLEAGHAGVASAPDRKPKRMSNPGENVRFSLAGIQLKFLVKDDRGSITVPANDGVGDLILKTPSPKYPLLPEAEYSALRLATEAGVRTSEARLVAAAKIEGIPREFLHGTSNSLAVRRFDRAPAGGRVHIEDFAQIVGAFGDRKYTMANQETVINIVRRFAVDPSGEVLEAVRRIVCDIMIGNGDAHLKNWSFIYKNGLHAELSPAYDIVPTFLYGDSTMALSFGGTRNPNAVTLHRFERAAGLLEVEPKLLVKEAVRTVERILDKWPNALAGLPLTDAMKKKITCRWSELAIVKEVRARLAQSGIASPKPHAPM